MIFISSIRPFADDDAGGAYQRNQLAAKESWERVATKIVYFNNYEPALDSPKTAFIPCERYVRLMDLIELAARQNEWCAILNGDIVIGPGFPMVEAKLRARKAKCASSWRYNFDPATGLSSGVHEDNGIDFFAAVPEVWQKGYELVDDRLYIGSTGWDCWALSLFCTFFQTHFWNLTNSRVIFHPNAAAHGARIHGPRVELDLVQTYGWPTMSSAHL